MDCHFEILMDLFNHKQVYNNSPNTATNLFNNKEIIIYGAGNGFITFSLFVIKRFNYKVRMILDNRFKTGDTYCGIPAFSPVDYIPTELEKEAVVVITVGKVSYHKEIFDCLIRLGFKNIFLYSDIYEFHLPFPDPNINSLGFDYYYKNKKSIIEAFNLLEDDLSREVFIKFLETHMHRIPVNIPSHPLHHQYFPKDIHLKKGYSNFICCGAYNGNSIQQLNEQIGKVDSIVCFEPDINSFQYLSQYLSSNKEGLANHIIALPLGVFNEEKQLRFDSGNMTNSAISSCGASIIQCVAMDSILCKYQPTFITMDIEGSELEALKGSKDLILDNTPDMAICIYHTPNHLWEIPLYIKKLHNDYKFYLRNYTSSTPETVLYVTT